MSIKVLCAHPIFNEYAFILSQRYECEIERDFSPKEGDLYLVLGGHEVAPILYQTQKSMNNKIGYIIYNSEQINSEHWRDKYYINLCRENPVYQYSNYLAQEIKDKFKINPYSYFFFEFLTFDKLEKESYDIVFLGARSKEREEVHAKLVSAYPDKKILFDFDYSYKNPQDLTNLLMGSKVVLNIPFYKDNPLETHRINKAISCGCKVVSLVSADLDANEFYKDYIYFVKNNNDLVTCLSDESFLTTSKKTYEDLTKDLAIKMTGHNIYVAKQIHTKLLDRVK